MPDPDFDPRGRANRALLVAVDHYRHAEDLRGVRHNLSELLDTLLNGGLFGIPEIDPVTPVKSSEFWTRLDRAADEARGLLLVYFAGHGRLSHDGSELFLTFGDSLRLPGDEPHYSESVSWNDVLQKLRATAHRGRVGRIVVILDCCYAGNALQSFRPGAVETGRDRISVLTAVQINRRIRAGDGTVTTPYTGHLVELLRNGVGAEDGLVRLAPLAAALQKALRDRTTEDGDPWEPRHHLAEGGVDVIVGVTGLRRPHAEPPVATRVARALKAAAAATAAALRGAGRRLRDAFRDAPRLPATVLTALATALAVLLAAGGYGVYRWVDGGRACAPPVQLRLLTDPDAEPTVSRAVDAFAGSSANHDGNGCRRAGISVDAPKAEDAVTGFQRAAEWQSPRSTGSFQPQRDIGAQPDVWIPGSGVSVKRALTAGPENGAATLDPLGPLAYTPLVLAVPRNLSVQAADLTGAPLENLVTKVLADNKPSAVLRADPEYTDAAQLATVGVYSTNEGAAPADTDTVRSFEQQAAQLSPAPRSSYELMCELASSPSSLEDNAAVIVPEQVMAQFNDATGPHDETGCDTGTLSRRLPEYPADVGMLDLPFVHVTWRDGDRDAAARDAAVHALYSWLTGKDGQRVFTDAGYRGRSDHDGDASPPPTGSWLTGDGHAVGNLQSSGYDVSGDSVDTALKEFRDARGAGQVLYLLDSSTSMGDDGNKVWSGPGRAKDLITQSLDAFGPGDEYGVWAVSGRKPPATPLVPFTSHTSAGEPAKLLAAATTGGEAHPGDALIAALAELKNHAGNGQPQLVVVLTDDEDDTWVTGRQLAELTKAARDQHVPVDWVSLTSGGCTAGNGHRGPQIAAATGGRCLDPSGNQAAGLHDEVDRVGTGDTP
ncbi:vWA domain-containing protein [Actinacidiphila acidipaludis]|uniref:VWA domain-containing protein n=1 Tax=Actinacidiphila acidipaludis TaxID=2873382 RepID=A0ABS7Q7U2_9ACTN|nr:vWA domain-containing protein [Streptomyces acidipaludis]MBY8879018.1 VWA domain-containing protein [Streptomyces acidipaludis]